MILEKQLCLYYSAHIWGSSRWSLGTWGVLRYTRYTFERNTGTQVQPKFTSNLIYFYLFNLNSSLLTHSPLS